MEGKLCKEQLRKNIRECKPELKELKIEQWGNIYLKKISAAGAYEYTRATDPNNKKYENISPIVVYVQNILCDCEGQLLFGVDELEELSSVEGEILMLIFNEALDFNSDDIDESYEDKKKES